MQISLKCALTSQAFGIRNSQIAFVLPIAIEVEMGLKGVPTEASSKENDSIPNVVLRVFGNRHKFFVRSSYFTTFSS